MDLSTERLQTLTQLVESEGISSPSSKEVPSLVMQLHKTYPEISSYELGLALEQLVLRSRARVKFRNPDNLLFLSESLEQATNWRIGQYIARRLEGRKVVDLTAGIGGDALMFGEAGILHSAVEYNEHVRSFLEHNLRGSDVHVLESWEQVDWSEVSVAYLDPSRRDEEGNVLASLVDWQPNLVEGIPFLLSKVDCLAIKISPAFRESDLDLLPEGWSLEVISYEGELKQAVLWYGFDFPSRQATMITEHEVYSFSGSDSHFDECAFSGHKDIFLPVAGIRRASLEDAFARAFCLSKIQHAPKLLSGEHQKNIEVWGRWYEYIDEVEGSLGDLRKKFEIHSIPRFDCIFLERIHLNVSDIYKKTRLSEGGEFVVFFALGEKLRRYRMILAKRKRGG